MGERLGRKHRPGAKNTGVSGKRAGPPPPSVPAVGKEEGAAGDRGGKWRREPSSRGAPRPRQKWRLFVLTEVREGGRTRRRGERVPGAADVSASGRETDGSTAEQCQGAGGDRGARACGARACGTRRPPASPPESLAFLNI